jgi:hypothetical protein
MAVSAVEGHGFLVDGQPDPFPEGYPLLLAGLIRTGLGSTPWINTFNILCVLGSLLVFLWYGGAEPAVFDVNLSFFILFMVIIGGLGSLTGSFFGAALIFILPIALRYFPPKLGIPVHPATVEHIQYMVIGMLIVLFLIAEPAGLARLWQIGKQKLRVWPFPY